MAESLNPAGMPLTSQWALPASLRMFRLETTAAQLLMR